MEHGDLIRVFFLRLHEATSGPQTVTTKWIVRQWITYSWNILAQLPCSPPAGDLTTGCDKCWCIYKARWHNQGMDW